MSLLCGPSSTAGMGAFSAPWLPWVSTWSGFGSHEGVMERKRLWDIPSDEGNHHGPVVQSGVHAGLSSRRSRVQIPSGPQGPSTGGRDFGRVAQLAERAPEKREVTGSTPVPTTE